MEALIIARAFNCKLSKFSMRYLVIAVSDRKLTKVDQSEVEGIINKKRLGSVVISRIVESQY